MGQKDVGIRVVIGLQIKEEEKRKYHIGTDHDWNVGDVEWRTSELLGRVRSRRCKKLIEVIL